MAAEIVPSRIVQLKDLDGNNIFPMLAMESLPLQGYTKETLLWENASPTSNFTAL